MKKLDARAHMGYGPKILVAIQDGPLTRVYTGILIEGEIRISTEMDDINMGMYTQSVPTGRRTITLNATFELQYTGGQMKTWADIRSPEEIESRKEITE